MVIRFFSIGLLGLSVAVPLAEAQTTKKERKFICLSRADDPFYETRRADNGLTRRSDRSADVHGSLLEVRVLGRKLGLAFELDELELAEGKTTIDAIKDAAGGDRHVFILDLPLDEMQDAASTLADGPALLLEVRHPDTELRQSFCPMGFSTQRLAGRWSLTRLRNICAKVVGETSSCSPALKKPTRKMLKLS